MLTGERSKFYANDYGLISDMKKSETVAIEMINGVKYAKVKQLGAGSYGTVYLAIDPRTGQEVAIKVPKQIEVVKAAAKNEVKMMKAMSNSPHAVHIVDHDAVNTEYPRIVMEYTP